MSASERNKRNILETEYEHKLQSQKNDYELQMEELRVEHAALEVDYDCKSTLLSGVCGELLDSSDPAAKRLGERVLLYLDLQFGTPEAEEREINILELLDSLVTERRIEANEKGVKLRGRVRSIRDTKAVLLADWVTELLRILVGDALRCAGEGDSVLLIGDQVEAKDGGVAYEFTVKDTASELPRSEYQFLAPFGEMRKENEKSGRVDLAIAERLAGLLGSELLVGASPDGGLTVSLTVAGKKA